MINNTPYPAEGCLVNELPLGVSTHGGNSQRKLRVKSMSELLNRRQVKPASEKRTPRSRIRPLSLSELELISRKTYGPELGNMSYLARQLL